MTPSPTQRGRLDIKDLRVSYGELPVIHGLDLTVEPGEIVVLLGANGAGKTTTLRAISKMDMVSVSGSILLDGQSIIGLRPEAVVRRGIAHVPQGRGTFSDLTVEENLRIGSFLNRKGINDRIAHWYEVFPRLYERRDQRAGGLSGGEQQMLAVSRALMSEPKVLLLDEPSLGLAPLVVQDLFHRFAELNERTGTSILVVEQNANLALDVADRAYVLERGEIAVHGPAAELRSHDEVRRAYLGF
ncbi:ABC transporter ATP-binding protein [Dactylosporangium sp. CA-092794]|uniref:ABC transporter ATP-binding protein n=1 Tax=Dactylosporangium sp. CA-092794 TaxID=3239929 RepID=UPI003D938565